MSIVQISETQADVVARARRRMTPNYKPQPVVFVAGEGAYLYDREQKRYLDFAGGIAVCCLGHAHPVLANAIAEQAKTLLHVSNLYFNQQQIDLADRLTSLSFADRVFFCNSGAEANEAALKLARRYMRLIRKENRWKFVCAQQSFHGRTWAAISATGQPHYHEGFAPLVPGFSHVPYADVAAIEAAIDDETCAVLLEPVQGEGGVIAPDAQYLADVRALCDRHRILLILDEVQTGVGRTGTWWAHEHSGITPDIMSIAKGLAGGVPIGAMLTTDEVSQGFAPGAHATTFGGNPLACRAALTVLKVIEQEGLLSHVERVGAHLRDRLNELTGRVPGLTGARGRGLLAGLGVDPKVVDRAVIIERCRNLGLLLTQAGPDALRLTPPYIVSRHQVDEAVDILERALTGETGGMKRDLLEVTDLSRAECEALLQRGLDLKAMRRLGGQSFALQGQTLAMVFEKASTRTRVSFDVAMNQLGGHAIMMAARDIQIGRGETIADTAKVLSRYVDGIMLRTFEHRTITELADAATVPVINGLTDLAHPCQVLADLLTCLEVFQGRVPLEGMHVAWIGDGNNMANTWINAARVLGFSLTLACPSGYEPDEATLEAARAINPRITVVRSPQDAAHGAHAVNTDVWASMGQEAEQKERERVFVGYQVDAGVMACARPEAIFLHCLPAHRGEEVSAEVLEGPQSRVFDQTENRLHIQKAILEWLMGGRALV